TWVTSLGKLTKKLNCSCVIAPTKCGNTIFQRPCGDGHNAIQRQNTCKEDTLQAGHVSGLFCLNHSRALNLHGDKNGAVGKADMPCCGAYVRFGPRAVTANWGKGCTTRLEPRGLLA